VTFFYNQNTDISMMTDISDFLKRKAALLDYNDFDPIGRIDYSFLKAMYGDEPYTYDPATGTLI